MNKHVELLCEKTIEKTKEASHISVYHAIIVVIIAVTIATFIQLHYFTTDRTDQDYFAKLFDRINDGDITEIDNKM